MHRKELYLCYRTAQQELKARLVMKLTTWPLTGDPDVSGDKFADIRSCVLGRENSTKTQERRNEEVKLNFVENEQQPGRYHTNTFHNGIATLIH